MGRLLVHFQSVETRGFFSPFNEMEKRDINLFGDGVFRTIYMPQPFLHPKMLDGFVCRRMAPLIEGAGAIVDSPLSDPQSRTGSLCPHLERLLPSGERLFLALLPKVIKKCAKHIGKRAEECEIVIAAGRSPGFELIADICAHFKYVSVITDEKIDTAILDALWEEWGTSVRLVRKSNKVKGDVWILAGGGIRPTPGAIVIDPGGAAEGAVTPRSLYIETDKDTGAAARAMGGSTAAEIEPILTFYHGARADFNELVEKYKFRLHIPKEINTNFYRYRR